MLIHSVAVTCEWPRFIKGSRWALTQDTVKDIDLHLKERWTFRTITVILSCMIGFLYFWRRITWLPAILPNNHDGPCSIVIYAFPPWSSHREWGKNHNTSQSCVSKATGYVTADPGFDFHRGQKIISSLPHLTRPWGQSTGEGEVRGLIFLL
jgi:hypothetical protein